MEDNFTTIRLNLLLEGYKESLEALKKKKSQVGSNHQTGYNNGKLDGEIHQVSLIIRDLQQVLKGEHNE